MNRPRHIWTIFTICLAVVLASTAWVTVTVLRLERAEAQAQRQAEFEERARLALWRMDSLLTPLIVEESARPVSHYKAFHSAGRAYTKGYAAAPDVLVPSPLLSERSSNVLLHFEVPANGKVTSPEVPAANEQRAVAVQSYTTIPAVALAAERLKRLEGILSAPAAASIARASNGELQVRVNRDLLFYSAAAPAAPSAPPMTNALLAANAVDPGAPMPSQRLNARPSDILQQQAQVQSVLNSVEFQARANVYQQAAQIGATANTQPARAAEYNSEQPVVRGVAMKPVWIGPALVLARRVNANGGTVVQGAWLNWDELKQMLLANIRDLFPMSDLRPANGTATGGDRMLAALPVEFVAHTPASADAVPWTPVRITVAVAWSCMLLAVVAVVVLLHGTVALSERRAAFVSAVTHELRTPLTTFKLYSEMLAGGMLTDAVKRQQYLHTLCSEANRLGHLVENVLAYARLESQPITARNRLEDYSLRELIGRVHARLAERAARSEMQFIVDADEHALAARVCVDVSAVEQILFNLVDNACKYAGTSSIEKLIHLEALPDGKFAMLRVRDHGQGIGLETAKRLFRPFSKSADEAAHSAPGIGLGLALCRRLSRSIGGDLRFDATIKTGACFELRLPASHGEEFAPTGA